MRNKWHQSKNGRFAAALLTVSVLALTLPGAALADAAAVLPTTSTGDLIKAREAWGMGAPAAKVEAPLAAGAVDPLPQDAVAAPAGPANPPIVHALVPVPVAQVAAIPEGQIGAAMKALLAEREGWGKAPAGAAPAAVAQAPAAAPAATPAAAPAPAAPAAGTGSGLVVLPTTSTGDLIKAREAWGMGAPAAKVEAPLAAGAVVPLPQDAVAVPAGPANPPIVHALVPVPVAQVAAIPEGQIGAAMKALIAEREGWGKAPAGAAPVAVAQAPAAAPAAPAAKAAAAVGGSGHAILPTTSTGDLIKAREAWGMGAPAKAVAAPLAAGAVSPLPQPKVAAAPAPAGEPKVHPLVATPPAQMTAVPEAKIADALKGLLATRAGWGSAPATRTAAAPAAAAPAAAGDKRSEGARSCEAKLRQAASSGAILFRTGKADLDKKSNATLDALVAVAKGCDKGKIRIEGHTDSSGSAARNKELSASRAEAVAAYLRKAGIARDRLVSAGYGAEKPIASNDTNDGRAKNRRIDFTVVE